MRIMRPKGRTGDLKSGEIIQVGAVNATSAEHIDDIVDKGRRVAFTRSGDETNAGELGPSASGNIKDPGVVVVKAAVSATEADGRVSAPRCTSQDDGLMEKEWNTHI